MSESRAFQLGGTEYRITAERMEKAMQGVAPRPLGKYFVLVNGVPFPPKQVISEALGKDLVKFTTMDATRILTALGFSVERVGDKREIRNLSELLFEQYLGVSGLSDFEYEKEFSGTTHRPDYFVKLADGRSVLFEVKEFKATLADFRRSGGAYDPYLHTREKIQQAREKFKPFKEQCCCLVLFNQEKPLVDLAWQFIYGAMLGNLGFRIALNAGSGTADETKAEQVFTGGGSMYRYQGLQPIELQNRTISAILVLELLRVGLRRFAAFVAQIEKQRGKEEGGLDVQEYLGLIEACRGTDRDPALTQLRGVVHENPHARIHFPSELFRGPYDERYGAKDGRIQRLYIGTGADALPSDRAW